MTFDRRLRAALAALLLTFFGAIAAHGAVDRAICSASDSGGTACTAAQLKTNANEEVNAVDARAPMVLGSVSGTNTILASVTPTLTALADGNSFYLKPANTITGAATLNINSIGAKALASAAGAALSSGDLQSTTIYLVRYYSTADEFRILSNLGTGTASASNAYVTIGNTGSLSAERALTAGTAISLTDGGANSTATIAVSDVELTSIAGLTSAADKIPYYTGLGTASLADFSAAIRTLITTPSSANLAAMLSDETGSGAAVFATSPTLTTPVLGVASATTINKVTLTAPATGSTLTIPDGVTLTGPASSGTAMTLGNTETVTGVKTFGSAGAVGRLKVAGTTSGSTVLDATAVASGTLTLPAATDTLVGKATTDTLTNKTFDTAGAGNSFSINGLAATANTGTGSVMRSTSPTVTTDITIPNTGLHLLDTNASHDLIVAPGSDLTADHTLTVTTGDADRTLTLGGNVTLTSGSLAGSVTGTNTGDQTITLTGDVTGSGTGSFAATVAADSVALGTDTTGNYQSGNTAGAGIAVTQTPAEGFSSTVALDYSDQGASPSLAADACQFTSNATTGGIIVCEGDTADTFETRIAVTDPTADRLFTIPDADSAAVQPMTCSGTDKVSGISAAGLVSCAADAGGAGSGDNIRVEDGDDAGTYTAASDADFGDSGDINFALNATPTPDEITATIRADSVALTTDTTGNYAAGDAEAGAALTGDSATAFFSAGTIELARGGTGASLTDPNADRLMFWDDSAAATAYLTLGTAYATSTTTLRSPTESFCVAASDESTAITTGTAKVTFRMPYAFTLTNIRGSLNTVSSSGSPIIDINEAGVSVATTNKLLIDVSEKTSVTAATAITLTDTSLADDAEMTIDVDTAGTGAKGLKVCLIGYQT